jgi:DNA-binding NarL/FixJ family response regulator
MAKVLIIDDDSYVHNLLDEEIKFQGGKIKDVIHALNGHEGVEKFILCEPKFVILDMRMNGMNGLETYKLINANDKNANVYLVTGYAQDDITHDAIRLGVKGYISKNNPNYIRMVVSLIISMLNFEE